MMNVTESKVFDKHTLIAKNLGADDKIIIINTQNNDTLTITVNSNGEFNDIVRSIVPAVSAEHIKITAKYEGGTFWEESND